MTALPIVDRVLVVLAVLLHVAIAVFPLSASGLLAPTWFLVVVALGWTGAAYGLWRLARSAPRLTVLVPLAVLAAWAALLALGDVVLGWTA